MAQHYRDDEYAVADANGAFVMTFKPPNANTAVTGTVAVFNSDSAALYTAEVGSATIGMAWGSWFGVSPFQVQMLGEVLIVRGSGNTVGKTYHGVLIGRADPLGQEDFTAPFSSSPVPAGGPFGSGVSQIIAGTAIGVSPAGGTGNVTVSNTGVDSVAGGTGITVSAATGSVTISATGAATGVSTVQTHQFGAGIPVAAPGFVGVGALPDAIIAAVVGDVLEVTVAGAWSSTPGSTCQMDAFTRVGGVEINSLSTGGMGGAGMANWELDVGVAGNDNLIPIAGGALYTVVAGDISGGTVRWTLEAKNTANANGNVHPPVFFTVKNFKH